MDSEGQICVKDSVFRFSGLLCSKRLCFTVALSVTSEASYFLVTCDSEGQMPSLHLLFFFESSSWELDAQGSSKSKSAFWKLWEAREVSTE